MKIESASGQSREVEVGPEGASIDGRKIAAVLRLSGDALAGVEIESVTVAVRAVRKGDRVFVWCGGAAYEFRSDVPGGRAGVRRGRTADAASDLLSPMPGRVRKVLVAEGDAVARGDVLMILEAMKMEHAIRSPREGRVVKLAFREGDLVDAGVPLAEVR